VRTCGFVAPHLAEHEEVYVDLMRALDRGHSVQREREEDGVSYQRVPGKRTLTEALGVDESGAAAAMARAGSEGPTRPVQLRFAVPHDGTAAHAQDPAQVQAAAARGTATTATQLPHAALIQRVFGRHDISGIQAHVGGDAAASAQAMGARAYATGNHVVLGDGADLHTVAHEAAHVVQQRGGVQLTGGVGAMGDRHEQHADEVADLVVQGKSAEALLDAYAPGAGSSGAGGGAPSTGGAVQGKWSRMSTTFTQADNVVVAQIANHVAQGNYVAAFRSVLGSLGGPVDLLARFNAAVTAYTNAGRLQIVTAALQASYDAPGKAYAAWEIVDEVEGGAIERLQRMFAARNVIVAGETHGDVEAGAMEAALLPAHAIQVRYESQTIQATAGGVTPDPPAYRLLYMIEEFYEQLLARKNNHDDAQARASHLALMDAAYGRYQHEFSNVARNTVEQSMDYQGDDLTSYARLDALRTILFETLELIEMRPADASVYDAPLIADNARNLLTLFGNLKQASGHSNNEPVMRKLRSDRMLDALRTDLAGAAKTVYKVGNNHIADLRARGGNLAWVLDQAAYKAIFRL